MKVGLASLATLALLVGTVLAQRAAERNQADDVDVQAGRNRVQVDVDRGADAGQSQKKRAVRVSEIMGVEVKNNSDEELGEIEDIVIDPDSGEIKYAAVSMGGFLGVGEKLFAVPWNAFECRKENGEHVAILNVDKATLENAQGFNEENWPDMANPRWQEQNDRAYQSARRLQRQPRSQTIPPRSQ